MKILDYALLSPHVQFKNFEQWKNVLSEKFDVVRSHINGGLHCLLFLFISYNLAAFTKNKIHLRNMLSHRFPGYLPSIYKKNTKFPIDAGYILNKR